MPTLRRPLSDRDGNAGAAADVPDVRGVPDATEVSKILSIEDSARYRVDDRPQREQWLASGVGLLAWFCFVGALLWLISSSSRPVPRVVTPQLSVELFEDIPPPAAPAPAAAAAPAGHTDEPAQDIALKSTPVRPPPPARIPKPVSPRPATPTPAPAPAPAPPQADAPPSTQAAAQPATDEANTAKTSDSNPSGTHPDSQATGASSNGNAPNGPARATYQPLPDIPDDYRSEAFAAVALARFTVHPDGNADVNLVEATHNPTLNRLLLASLRKWHFAAAIQDGHPVETTIELRVHFNVQ